MHVDLITLYLLAIGTLLASSGMTLLEHRSHPKRSRELRILAAGYATLAVGCAIAPFRRYMPGLTGAALSNLVIEAGYLLLLHGVASLNRRRYGAVSVAILVVLALTWAVVGVRWPMAMWAYVSAFPIALASGLTARELLRCDGMRGFQARDIAIAVVGIHALFYASRAFVLPWLATRFGQGLVLVAGEITMYEGVLYSVILPMTLLKLIREETHGELVLESHTDYLTRLGNRRWFFEEGGRVLSRVGAGRPVSLLALDLDHFKKINDRYGHKAGDEVLKSFAGIVRTAMGPAAVLARIGGEEFAALLPDHDVVGAREVGEIVVQRFAG